MSIEKPDAGIYTNQHKHSKGANNTSCCVFLSYRKVHPKIKALRAQMRIRAARKLCY